MERNVGTRVNTNQSLEWIQFCKHGHPKNQILYLHFLIKYGSDPYTNFIGLQTNRGSRQQDFQTNLYEDTVPLNVQSTRPFLNCAHSLVINDL